MVLRIQKLQELFFIDPTVTCDTVNNNAVLEKYIITTKEIGIGQQME